MENDSLLNNATFIGLVRIFESSLADTHSAVEIFDLAETIMNELHLD